VQTLPPWGEAPMGPPSRLRRRFALRARPAYPSAGRWGPCGSRSRFALAGRLSPVCGWRSLAAFSVSPGGWRSLAAFSVSPGGWRSLAAFSVSPGGWRSLTAFSGLA